MDLTKTMNVTRRKFLKGAVAAPLALTPPERGMAQEECDQDTDSGWRADDHPFAHLYLLGLWAAIDAIRQCRDQSCTCEACCTLKDTEAVLGMFESCVDGLCIPTAAFPERDERLAMELMKHGDPFLAGLFLDKAERARAMLAEK